MGGGASKGKKQSKIQGLDGLDIGSDDLAPTEKAPEPAQAAPVIKPLWEGQMTPQLPTTYSESLLDSPPDDDGDQRFISASHGLASAGSDSSRHVGKPSTPPSFHEMNSSWNPVAPSTPARSIGGGGLCAGEATDIGGRKENQDTSFGMSLIGGEVWAGGVLDGHGAEGKIAAEFGSGRIQHVIRQREQELLSNPEAVLKAAFKSAHEGMSMAADCTYSGTTAVCCIVAHGVVTVAWVGDSRAVVGNLSGESTVALTEDHRPEVASECDRVEAAGGLVRRSNGGGPMRVYGGATGAVGLMLTRSLGDIEMHEYGVSADAQVASHTLRPGVDQMLLMGSDGVFDAMNNLEAIVVAGRAASNASGGDAGALAGAGAVVGEAAEWWRRHPGSDNITAVVVTPLA